MIVPLDPQIHQRELFDSGNLEINVFIIAMASQQQRDGTSQTYVLVDDEPSEGLLPIKAYVTFMPIVTEFSARPGKKARSVPCLLLARMGVDLRYQKRGHASELIEFTFESALRLRDLAGCAVVLVDPKEGVAALYEKHGFIQLEEGQSRLFITTSALQKRVRAVGR